MSRPWILRAAPLLPLVFVFVGGPMALKLVPPNGFYGVRTAEALSSADAWYSANFAAGAVAVLFGLAATAINIAVRRSAATPAQKLHIPFLTTIGVGVAVTVAGVLAV
jgi:uncharacterized membrane protein